MFTGFGRTWEDIKPASPSGVTDARATVKKYRAALWKYGFDPESWQPTAQPIMVNNDAMYFFAVKGILFYTRSQTLYNLSENFEAIAEVTAALAVAGSVSDAVSEVGMFTSAESAISTVNAAEASIDIAVGF